MDLNDGHDDLSASEWGAANLAPESGLKPGKAAMMAFSAAGAALTAAVILAAMPAAAQTRAGYANEFSQSYGMNMGDDVLPYDPRTRDLNGNRVIVDGRIVTGDNLSSLPLGLYNSGGNGMNYSGTGYAIGNQLNVTTTGNFNTVIVNSSQINNGDQTVIIQGPQTTGVASSNASQVLNGGLDF